MSNYTKATNFATKDALSSGDPLKIVKGTEINTEFDAIATAIATKADTVSPTFTGTPSLPTGTTGVTQSASDDSTKLATTAFVQDVADAIKQALFPVGSIYTNSSVSTNPGTLLGFGTWTAFGAGRVMVGFDSGNALFDSAEETGGSADAVVVEHNHTITDPGHTHTYNYDADANVRAGSNGGTPFTRTTQNTGSNTTGITIDNEGVSGTNANLQPYLVVYMWKRTA